MTKRVLVVDDDDSIRETFQYHLDRAGYQVTTAESAEEALGLMAEAEPGIVITDIRMPGMDGLELLRRIRAASPETDVLVITAHEDMQSASAAMREGAYDYLVKPLDLDRIETLVDRCFRDQQLRRRSEQYGEEAAEPYALDQLQQVLELTVEHARIDLDHRANLLERNAGVEDVEADVVRTDIGVGEDDHRAGPVCQKS